MHGPVAGPCRYRRQFNRPTGLEPEQTVWLLVHGWTGSLQSLELNDSRLEIAVESRPVQVKITELLDDRNTLEIRIDTDGEAPPSLIGPVELAIE